MALALTGDHGQRGGDAARFTDVALDARQAATRIDWSERVMAVCTRFGLTAEGEQVLALNGVPLRLGPGRVVLLSGPSGSGKTSLLHALARQQGNARFVERVTFAPAPAVVDQVLAPGELIEAISILTGCGMGEPRLWVRRFDELSDGEQFRARLARAMGLARRDSAPAILLCDEFCAGLGRRLAKTLAYNVRKLTSRLGLCLVAAGTHEDIERDLQADAVIRLSVAGAVRIEEHTPTRRPISLARRMRIERGGRRDYERFAAMHYRAREELGFVDRVFVMRQGGGREPVGIIVYSHSPLELALRNRATNGRFIRNAKRLNRELRILRRVVIDPELRGCGLAKMLVRRTLPLVGVRYVECLANMGDVNPVFERAGMKRIGRCEVPRARQRIGRELAALGGDPLSAEFTSQVARRPKVRRLVAEAVYRWYCGLTSCGTARARTSRQSAEALARTYRQLVDSRPVYYLWQRRE